MRRANRRGITLVYITAIMVVLVGFISLSVDYGRVQMAASQLRTAADGAALAGGQFVKTSHDDAKSAALEVAESNICITTAVDLDEDQDIFVGKWNYYTRQFTASANSTDHANAIKVLAHRTTARGNPINLVFGKAIGFSSWDVTAGAVAASMGGTANLGIVGIDSLTMTGTTQTDSYNSTSGSYNAANHLHNGDVYSNGLISASGTVDIDGSIHTGPSGDNSIGSNVTVSGDQYPVPDALSYPPVNAAPYATNNDNSVLPTSPTNKPIYDTATKDFNLGANTDFTLPSSTSAASPKIYYFRNFTISGTSTLHISGYVTIYITGNIDIAGNCGDPANSPPHVTFNVAGTGTVSLAGNGTQTKATYGTIYAPQATVNLKGNHNLYGAVIGKTLSIVGTSEVHYDEALNKSQTWPEEIRLVG
jgi:hypothetical protein